MLARIVAATAAGGISFFIVGFLVYGLFLDPMFTRPNIAEYAGLMKEPPSWIPLVLSNLVIAFLFAVIYECWAGIKTFATGARAGAIICALIALYFDLSFFAFMHLFKNFIPLLADVAGGIVLGVVAGGVIGSVLGMMNKGSAPAAE